MKKIVFMAIAVLTLTACSTFQSPRYAISVDNVQKLKNYEGVKAEVISLSQPTSFDSNCRGGAPIKPADGLTFSQFISKAFNDEFKLAGIYSEDHIKISVEITKIEFSSMDSLFNGYWDIGLKLVSSNGQSLSVSNKYTFDSEWDGLAACKATAGALPPAVQDLITATITDSEFGKLLK